MYNKMKHHETSLTIIQIAHPHNRMKHFVSKRQGVELKVPSDSFTFAL